MAPRRHPVRLERGTGAARRHDRRGLPDRRLHAGDRGDQDGGGAPARGAADARLRRGGGSGRHPAELLAGLPRAPGGRRGRRLTSDPTASTRSVRGSQILVLYRKEMRTALRERSIVLNSILLPIFLYPVMLWLMFTEIGRA